MEYKPLSERKLTQEEKSYYLKIARENPGIVLNYYIRRAIGQA